MEKEKIRTIKVSEEVWDILWDTKRKFKLKSLGEAIKKLKGGKL